jgi:hypothetical protein
MFERQIGLADGLPTGRAEEFQELRQVLSPQLFRDFSLIRSHTQQSDDISKIARLEYVPSPHAAKKPKDVGQTVQRKRLLGPYLSELECLTFAVERV